MTDQRSGPSDRLRILVIQPWLSYRGAETASVALACGLARAGHSARLLTVYVDRHRPPEALAEADVVEAWAPFAWLCKRHTLVYLLLGPPLLFVQVWRNATGASVLNPHNAPSLWIAALVGRLKGIPVAWTCHSLPSSRTWKTRSSLLDYIAWRLSETGIEGWALQHASAVIANSEALAAQLWDRYRVRAIVIHPPLAPVHLNALAAANDQADGAKVLTVGRIDADKNQGAAVEAVAIVARTNPDVRLVIAGDGPGVAGLRQRVQELRVEDRVDLLGYVRPGELTNLYRQCPVTLVPSLCDAWGSTPFEALAGGSLPVVSVKAGSADVIRRERLGFVCGPSAQEIVQGLKDALAWIHDRGETVARGRGYIRSHLTPEIYTEACLRVFRSVRDTARAPCREAIKDHSSLTRGVPRDEYDRAYYQRAYPDRGPLWQELQTRTRKALEAAGVRPGMHVLDIGCGPGDLMEACVRAGCVSWGVDYSGAAVRLAASRSSGLCTQEDARCHLQVMNAKALAFPSGRFDVVFMTDIVEHLYPEELAEALREAARVIRRPGRLVIRTAPNALLTRPIYRIAGLLLHVKAWNTEHYHVNEMSPRRMAIVLEALGLPFSVRMGKASGAYFHTHLPTIAGKRLRAVARAIDFLLDSRWLDTLVFRTSLQYVLGTEIWAVVEV